ncbi:MAG TPA: hypothetical protein VIW29_05085 [Polyangiaceae bacterium]
MSASLLAAAWLAAAGEAAAESRENYEQGADCQLCSEGASGLELTIPLWVPIVGMGGKHRNDDGDTEEVDYDTQVQFAFMSQARLRLGPISLDFTGNGGGLGSQVIRSDEGEVLGELDLHGYFGKLALSWYTPAYRLGQGSKSARLALWPYAGARYAWLVGSGSTAEGLYLEGDTTWGEPVFGMRTMLDMRGGWLFGVEGDVGGFNVGTELSVWVNARVQYAMTDWWHLWLGWVLYYARLSSEDTKSVDLMLQGPGIGIGFSLF